MAVDVSGRALRQFQNSLQKQKSVMGFLSITPAAQVFQKMLKNGWTKTDCKENGYQQTKNTAWHRNDASFHYIDGRSVFISSWYCTWNNGATLFVLWAVHITLNRKWYSSDTRMQNHTSTRLHLRLTRLYHSRSMAVFNLATTILFPQLWKRIYSVFCWLFCNFVFACFNNTFYRKNYKEKIMYWKFFITWRNRFFNII